MPRFMCRRTKTPLVLQLEAAECGAAALGSVLGYFGRHVPLAELREQCGVSRNGSKASNIVKAARAHGLHASGYRVELRDIQELACPLIVHWHFRHFVVVEGATKGSVFLNDPATGHRKVTWQEFDEGFTGVVLQFQPTPDFTKSRKARTKSGLGSRLRSNWKCCAFCLVVGLLLVLPGLAMPTYARIFLDDVLIGGRSNWLRPLVVFMIGTLFMEFFLGVLQLRYLRRLRISLSAKLNAEYVQHLLHLPARFYHQRFPGEIVARSRLNDKVAAVLSGQLARTCMALTTMLVYAAVMFYYSVTLTLVGILFAIANFVVLRCMAAWRVETNMRLVQDIGQVQATTIAGLQGIETIKTGGTENGFFAKWASQYANAHNARQQLEIGGLALGIVPSLLSSLATVAVLLFGARDVIQGEMTLGMVVAFLGLMSGFLSPVSSLVGLAAVIQELQGDTARLDDVLDNQRPAAATAAASNHNFDFLLDRRGEACVKSDREISQSETFNTLFPCATSSPGGQVELRDVVFGYSHLEPPLLEGLNLCIQPGRRVALVGGSGSGKSTIAQLLCGLYEPWSGEVLFDGTRRQNFTPQARRRYVAMVAQHATLFEGTIRDNLSLWDRTISDEELLEACRDAQAWEIISRLPGGLDAQLREGGGNLSGGQRQLLNQAIRTAALVLLFWFAVRYVGPTSLGEADGASVVLTLGTFLAFRTAFDAFVSGVTGLSDAIVSITDSFAKRELVRPLLDAQPEGSAAVADPGCLTGQVSISDVRFRYGPDDPLVLDDVTLDAGPGDFVAIVGPSGSGKSTLLRLLLGLESPESGTVRYNGLDLAGLDLAAVRRQIGTVLQSAHINAGSIIETISLGHATKMDEVLQAIHDAGFEEDVARMPMGLQTLINEGATNLSGGQRQRLLIARALVANPKILLFDEATSALDNCTQEAVASSIARRRATRIVVAHRLSTIRRADTIYVMDRGRFVQRGSYAELVQQDGLFQRMAAQQRPAA